MSETGPGLGACAVVVVLVVVGLVVLVVVGLVVLAVVPVPVPPPPPASCEPSSSSISDCSSPSSPWTSVLLVELVRVADVVPLVAAAERCDRHHMNPRAASAAAPPIATGAGRPRIFPPPGREEPRLPCPGGGGAPWPAACESATRTTPARQRAAPADLTAPALVDRLGQQRAPAPGVDGGHRHQVVGVHPDRHARARPLGQVPLVPQLRVPQVGAVRAAGAARLGQV